MTRGAVVAAAVALSLGAVLCALVAGTFGLLCFGVLASGTGVVALAVQLAGDGRPDVIARRDDADGSAHVRSSFPTYKRIRSAVWQSEYSARHYDHGTRPLMQRLLDARLADRYGVELATSDLARRRLGERLWPLVDPERPPSQDSRAEGVSAATLTELLDALERM